GDYVVYPSSEHPETLWRRDWPVPLGSDPVAWLRRRAGLVVHRSAPRLRLDGEAGSSLAAAVLADLGRETGEQWRLVGVLTAGRTVLRARSGTRDAAVRVAVTSRERAVDPVAPVREQVPGVAAFLPTPIAEGSTSGHPWTASEWMPQPRRSLRWPWPSADDAWATAEELVDLLAAHPTGRTGPGWAEAWCARVALAQPEERRAWQAAMEVLDDGIPTTWCHGDLWRGNLVVHPTARAVLDWENSSPDGPQGLDRLLFPALRDAAHAGSLTTADILRLVDEPDDIADAMVGGRRWAAWDRPHRLALALAAVALYLRNRSLHDLGEAPLRRHLDAVTAALQPAVAPVEPSTGTHRGRRAAASRTARGAVWLGVNGVIVKTSQTVVLLTLAALLAPEALGLVAVGTLVANISGVIASLGTASALVYWRGDVERAARTAVTLGAGTGALLALTIWLAAPTLAAALGVADGGADVIRGLTVTLPLLAVAAVTNELLRRRLAFLRRIIPDAVSSIIGAAVAVVLVTAFDTGVMALVVGQIVQGVLTLLLSWCVHRPVLPGWNHEDARGLLAYGGPYAGANLIELIQLNVDYVIVSTVLGAAALGQYSLAFRLAFMPYLMIVFVISGAAFPYLCRLRRPQLAPAAITVMSATLTLVAPLCVGLLMLSDHLTLLGDKWAPAVPVVGWLAAYAVLLSVGQLVQTTLNAAGRPTISMCLRLLHLVLLAAILLAVVDRGVEAVAVGQVVAACCVAAAALLGTRVLLRGFSLRTLAASLQPAAVGVVTMVAAMVLARSVAEPDDPSVVSLLTLGGIGMVAYLLPVWFLDRRRLRAVAALVRGAA
ncbi:MAG TPA: oligosaccharide flippase family protein, partial [Nocardioides sp.]|nr:oligosaccharide flippase family protein [Nocardioides sp.]